MDSADVPLKTVVKGAGIFFIGMLFSKFFNYFFRLIAARLGTETYGLVTLSLSLVSVLAVIATLGLNNGVLRFVPFYSSKGENKKVAGIISYSIKTSFVAGLVIGFLLFIFSGFISRTFFPHVDPDVFSSVLKVIAFSLPLTAVLFIQYASFEAFRFLKYEIYTKNIFDGAFKLALTFLAVYFGYGIFGIAFVYVASVLGSVLLSWYYLKRYFSFARDGVEYVNRELLVYSVPLVLSGLCIILISSVDSWIIGYFMTASDVGLYNAAMPTAQILYTIPSIILILFLPVLSELFSKGDRKAFRSVYSSVTKWIFLVNLPLLVLFGLFSRQIFSILFGAEYVSASIPLIVLSLGFFVNSVAMTSERMLMVLKRTKFVLLAYISVLVINAVLNLFLVPVYGIVGAAVASAVSYIVLALFFIAGGYGFSRIVPFNFDYLKAVFAAAISLGVAFLVMSLASYSVYLLVFAVVLFGVVYLGLLFLFRAFDTEDIMIMRSIRGKLSSVARNIR